MGAVDRPWTRRVGRHRTWPLEVARAQTAIRCRGRRCCARRCARSSRSTSTTRLAAIRGDRRSALPRDAPSPGHSARCLRPVSSRRSRRPHPVRGMPAGRFACWLRSIPFADRRERVLQMPEEECIRVIASSDEIKPMGRSSNPTGPQRARAVSGSPNALGILNAATAGHGLVAAVLTGCGCDGTIANTLNLPAGVQESRHGGCP